MRNQPELERISQEEPTPDITTPEFLAFAEAGAKTPDEELTPECKRREPRIRLSFDIPVSINEKIEEVLDKRTIKIPKTQWVLRCITKALKIKDM